jgi:hypothetical protein
MKTARHKTDSTTFFITLIKNSGAHPIKRFTAVIYGFLQYPRVFVPDKHFQPSLMFGGEAGAYRSEALASPTNIRLGWKGLPGTNTQAYHENP